MTPIESLLDKVDWQVVETPTVKSTIPHVTHCGKLKMLDIEIDVLLLSNGQRIFTEEGMAQITEWMEKH